MEKQIKDLRVKIDGLATLVKGLKPLNMYVIDLAKIPVNWDAKKWIEYANQGNIVLDSDKDSTNPIKDVFPSKYKEIEKSVDCLLLAKAWLGKCLEEIGTESPYKSGYKTKEDIEKTADTGPHYKQFDADYSTDEWGITHPFIANNNDKGGNQWKDTSHIEKVDWLREEIQKLSQIDIVLDLSLIKKEQTILEWFKTKEIAPLKKSVEYLIEARFWLGFELQRIKESK